jgi:hypothetical protein
MIVEESTTPEQENVFVFTTKPRHPSIDVNAFTSSSPVDVVIKEIESDDLASVKFDMSRGISIISVSDDERISRDVSTEKLTHDWSEEDMLLWSKRSLDSNIEHDDDIEKLMERIRKQRSVLEDILDNRHLSVDSRLEGVLHSDVTYDEDHFSNFKIRKLADNDFNENLRLEISDEKDQTKIIKENFRFAEDITDLYENKREQKATESAISQKSINKVELVSKISNENFAEDISNKRIKKNFEDDDRKELYSDRTEESSSEKRHLEKIEINSSDTFQDKTKAFVEKIQETAEREKTTDENSEEDTPTIVESDGEDNDFWNSKEKIKNKDQNEEAAEKTSLNKVEDAKLNTSVTYQIVNENKEQLERSTSEKSLNENLDDENSTVIGSDNEDIDFYSNIENEEKLGSSDQNETTNKKLQTSLDSDYSEDIELSTSEMHKNTKQSIDNELERKLESSFTEKSSDDVMVKESSILNESESEDIDYWGQVGNEQKSATNISDVKNEDTRDSGDMNKNEENQSTSDISSKKSIEEEFDQNKLLKNSTVETIEETTKISKKSSSDQKSENFHQEILTEETCEQFRKEAYTEEIITSNKTKTLIDKQSDTTETEEFSIHGTQSENESFIQASVEIKKSETEEIDFWSGIGTEEEEFLPVYKFKVDYSEEKHNEFSTRSKISFDADIDFANNVGSSATQNIKYEVETSSIESEFTSPRGKKLKMHYDVNLTEGNEDFAENFVSAEISDDERKDSKEISEDVKTTPSDKNKKQTFVDHQEQQQEPSLTEDRSLLTKKVAEIDSSTLQFPETPDDMKDNLPQNAELSVKQQSNKENIEPAKTLDTKQGRISLYLISLN